MTQVIILISTLIFADLREGEVHGASAKSLLREIDRFGVELNYESAVPDPDRPQAVYLTLTMDGSAHEFAENIRTIEGVFSSFVKPAEELP